MKARPSTIPGYRNHKGQINLGRTKPPRPGTDHVQIVYVMRCPECSLNYGANGSDIWQRKCPYHAGGRPGEKLLADEQKWTTPHG